MAADLRADVTELKKLLSQARRPHVQVFLSAQIGSIEKLAADAEVKAAAQKPAVPEVRYETLNNLSWEQDNERVKIYVSMENVREENVASKFDDWTCDVKIHNVEGKNFRFAIHKLHKLIDPDSSRVIVKPKRVIISLRKLEEEDWRELYFKEDKSEEESKKEPMTRLLEMMKNMYDDGDDEMKKTISDAWTTYRSTYKPGFKKPIPSKK